MEHVEYPMMFIQKSAMYSYEIIFPYQIQNATMQMNLLYLKMRIGSVSLAFSFILTLFIHEIWSRCGTINYKIAGSFHCIT